MKFNNLNECVEAARAMAETMKHSIYTPEHFLLALSEEDEFKGAFEACHGNVEALQHTLKEYLNSQSLEGVGMVPSSFMEEVITVSQFKSTNSSANGVVNEIAFFAAIVEFDDSFARFAIEEQGIAPSAIIRKMNGGKAPAGGPAQSIFGIDFEDEDWHDYVTDISEAVKSPDYIPLVGRKQEIADTWRVLCRMKKNNAMHIGDPGVGKTAIAYGIAERIEKDEDVPAHMKNAHIWGLDMATLIAGTEYRGEFEERLQIILEGLTETTEDHVEVDENGDETLVEAEKPIVYIDEIHMMVGAGATGAGAMDASNILKPFLQEGKIRFIGSTTREEYKKAFRDQKALARRFENIDINEPTEAETVEILKGIQKAYEDYHNVKYVKGVIEDMVALSGKYIRDRFWPDKAIDLMDISGATLQRDNATDRRVTKKMIKKLISERAHIPNEDVEKDESKALKEMPNKLKERVFGQDEAVEQLVRAIRISRSGLNEDDKPIASLLFVGPTGVGKTEIAKALADTMNVKLVRFDMSEFMEKASVAKFIGSPAGYVGYEDGGRLTDEIKKNPHCVLLLDEVEKAHPDVMNVLLQVMDNAKLTDSQGNEADFRNVVLLMTSNAGASEIGKPQIGFGKTNVNETAMDEAVKKFFAPEFRNRLTGIVKFNPMNDTMALQVVDKDLKALSDRMEKKGIALVFKDAIREFIKTKGVSLEYGAREIQRTIDREIKPQLVDYILFETNKSTKKVIVDYDKSSEKITFAVA